MASTVQVNTWAVIHILNILAWQLIIDIDSDGLSLGVVKAVHGVDGREHAETKGQDQTQDQCAHQSHPDSGIEETHTVIGPAKLCHCHILWVL